MTQAYWCRPHNIEQIYISNAWKRYEGFQTYIWCYWSSRYISVNYVGANYPMFANLLVKHFIRCNTFYISARLLGFYIYFLEFSNSTIVCGYSLHPPSSIDEWGMGVTSVFAIIYYFFRYWSRMRVACSILNTCQDQSSLWSISSHFLGTCDKLFWFSHGNYTYWFSLQSTFKKKFQ